MSGQAENLPAFAGEKLVGGALALADKLHEGVGPETSSNGEAADPVGDVNQPVHDFDFRRTLDQYGRVQIATRHVPSIRHAPIRQGIGTQLKSLIQINLRELADMVNSPTANPARVAMDGAAYRLRPQFSSRTDL